MRCPVPWRREDVTPIAEAIANPRLMRTLVAFTTIAATAASLLLGGSRPNSIDFRESESADVTVSIRTFQFAPDTLHVKVGTKVVWMNGDEVEHTITSGTPDAPSHQHQQPATSSLLSFGDNLDDSAWMSGSPLELRFGGAVVAHRRDRRRGDLAKLVNVTDPRAVHVHNHIARGDVGSGDRRCVLTHAALAVGGRYLALAQQGRAQLLNRLIPVLYVHALDLIGGDERRARLRPATRGRRRSL